MFYCESGKRLVHIYNERNDTNMSIEEFFYEIYTPLFFDNGNLLSVNNSPYTNPSSSKKTLSEKNENMRKKIEDGKYDASVYVGGPAESVFSATRTLFEEGYYKIDANIIYTSWIGHSLSLMVNGGYCLSLNDDDLIYEVFLGWKEYRKLINSELKMSQYKVNSWNTAWLMNKYSNNTIEGFNYEEYLDKDKIKDELIVKTQFWGKVIFMLSKIIKKDYITPYVYLLSQQNCTIGFIPIKLNESRKIITSYKHYFGESDYLTNKDKIETLFGSYYNTFDKVAVNGVIGYHALRPRYNDIKKDKNDNKLKFNTYKTWIMVILNEKASELDKLSMEFAEYLIDFESRDTKTMKSGKSGKRIFLEEFFTKSRNRNSFIRFLASISREDDINNEIVMKIKNYLLNLDNNTISMFVDLTSLNYNSISK